MTYKCWSRRITRFSMRKSRHFRRRTLSSTNSWRASRKLSKQAVGTPTTITRRRTTRRNSLKKFKQSLSFSALLITAGSDWRMTEGKRTVSQSRLYSSITGPTVYLSVFALLLVRFSSHTASKSVADRPPPPPPPLRLYEKEMWKWRRFKYLESRRRQVELLMCAYVHRKKVARTC